MDRILILYGIGWWSYLIYNLLILSCYLFSFLLLVIFSFYFLNLFLCLLYVVFELVWLYFYIFFTFAWYMFIWAANYFIFFVFMFRALCRADSFSAVSNPGCLFIIYLISSICFCFWWTNTYFSTTCSVLKINLFWRVFIF